MKTEESPAPKKKGMRGLLLFAIIAVFIVLLIVTQMIAKYYRERDIVKGMVYIEGGMVEFGGDPAHPWEGQAKKVYIDAFYIDPYEVTNAEYKKFVDAGGYQTEDFWSVEGWRLVETFKDLTGKQAPAYWSDCTYPEGKDDFPVTGVCYYEADAYAKWLGKALPSRQEWEMAAGWDPENKRMREYPWGDKFETGKSNTAEAKANGPVPAGAFKEDKSYYGCYDMGGNLLEWTSSISPTQNEPGFNKSPVSLLILKGGAYEISGAKFSRVASIAFSDPPQNKKTPIIGNFAFVRKHPYYGFRCVYRPKK